VRKKQSPEVRKKQNPEVRKKQNPEVRKPSKKQNPEVRKSYKQEAKPCAAQEGRLFRMEQVSQSAVGRRHSAGHPAALRDPRR
jgi:hypothetical protein